MTIYMYASPFYADGITTPLKSHDSCTGLENSTPNLALAKIPFFWTATDSFQKIRLVRFLHSIPIDCKKLFNSRIGKSEKDLIEQIVYCSQFWYKFERIGKYRSAYSEEHMVGPLCKKHDVYLTY